MSRVAGSLRRAIRRGVKKSTAVLALLSLSVWIGCDASRMRRPVASDPREGEVRLETTGAFDAYLVHASDVGIWTVKCLPLLDRYGCPEIVALDDLGRCTILNSYSGKWTPWVAVQDGLWLGGIALCDIDPRRPGPELYVGGKRGNLYQIKPLAQGGFDTNVVAYIPGREIHTLVAGDVDSTRPGSELLVFTRPGGLYRVTPLDQPGREFACELLEELPGRIRDAVILPAESDARPAIVTVSRAGEAALLRFEAGRPAWTTIFRAPIGLGRIAARPPVADEPTVLYVSADDGRIVRLERQADGGFRSETIYAGPQGPRGVAAGRFGADPAVETVAVFGYSRKVQLLTRDGDEWRVETIFEDLDKGHWLAPAEVDGRNATDELILSGYSARVVLLARPPGYGLAGRTATSAR